MKEGSEVPRRGKIAKRDVLPDPLYNSKLVTRLINNVMIDGKKGVAQKIVYEAFDIIREKTGKEPLEVFEAAMENVMPVLEVKARRVGGATYQVPMEVRPERRQTLGLRWITLYSRQRSERTMKERLLTRSWMPSIRPVRHSRSVRILTRWPRPTRHCTFQVVISPIYFAIRTKARYGGFYAERGFTGKDQEYRNHGAY